jgi:hypothetical protein
MSLPPLTVRAALGRILEDLKPDPEEYDDWYDNTIEHRRAEHPFDDYRIVSTWLKDSSDTVLATQQMYDALQDAETEIMEMLEDLCDEPQEDIGVHRTLATIRAATHKAHYS